MDDQPKFLVSGCVICKNNADKIARTLDSLGWCDEIVVVDSGSTDGTVGVCEGHGSGKVRVIQSGWRGFNKQREYAASACRNAWVLMLDADEECGEELRGEILGLTEEARRGVGLFKMPRKNFVMKRHVRVWGPDFQTRLVHRERVEWDARSIPEIRKVKAGFRVGKLKGAILHNRLTELQATDFNDGVKQAMYAVELAEHMRLKGKRGGWVNLFFRPWMTFLKYYVLRGAFLEGRFGLAIAYKTTIMVMLKYSVLYAEGMKGGEKQETGSKEQNEHG